MIDKKLINAFSDEPEVLRLLEQREANELQKEANELTKKLLETSQKEVILKGATEIKGDKGDTGDKGEKGEDGNDGKDGQNGEDGVDGENGSDGENGINGKDGKKGEKGDKGDKGEDGKDGENAEISDVIAELKKKQYLEPKDIKGMPINMNDMRWHGGGISNITGLIEAGNNITIDGSGTKTSPYVINSEGGGGGGSPSAPIGSIQYNLNGTDFGGSSNATVTSTGLSTWADLMTVTADTNYGSFSWASPVNGGIGGMGIEGNNNIITGTTAGDTSIWSIQNINFSANGGSSAQMQLQTGGTLSIANNLGLNGGTPNQPGQIWSIIPPNNDAMIFQASNSSDGTLGFAFSDYTFSTAMDFGGVQTGGSITSLNIQGSGGVNIAQFNQAGGTLIANRSYTLPTDDGISSLITNGNILNISSSGIDVSGQGGNYGRGYIGIVSGAGNFANGFAFSSTTVGTDVLGVAINGDTYFITSFTGNGNLSMTTSAGATTGYGGSNYQYVQFASGIGGIGYQYVGSQLYVGNTGSLGIAGNSNAVIDGSTGNIYSPAFITNGGTSAQVVLGDGTLGTYPDPTVFVPYTGATGNVDLGLNSIISTTYEFTTGGYMFGTGAYAGSNQALILDGTQLSAFSSPDGNTYFDNNGMVFGAGLAHINSSDGVGFFSAIQAGDSSYVGRICNGTEGGADPGEYLIADPTLATKYVAFGYGTAVGRATLYNYGSGIGLYIYNSGEFAIGNSPDSPSSNGFYVNAISNVYATSFITSGGTSSQVVLGDGSLGTYAANVWTDSGSGYIYPTSNQSVYIGGGTSNPFGALLDVESSINSTVAFTVINNSSGTNAQAGFGVLNDLGHFFQAAITSSTNSNFVDTTYFNWNTAGGARFYSFAGGGPLSFGTNNALQMRIDGSSSHVIIDPNGTFTDDGNMFQVKGTASFSQQITADYYIFGNGNSIGYSGSDLNINTTNIIMNGFVNSYGFGIGTNYINGGGSDIVVQDRMLMVNDLNSSTGNWAISSSTGAMSSNAFITAGGASTDFVKGDGSLDGTTYQVSGTYPKIVASGNLLAQSATVSSVVTYTTPNDSTTHSFRVGGYTAITAISAGTLTISFTFTDENNTSRTLNFFPMGLTSAGLTTTGFDSFPPANIRCKANTAITITATFVGVSVTFDVGGTIESLY